VEEDITPPSGFEWLLEEEPKDELIAWADIARQIGVIIKPDKPADAARRDIKKQIIRAIQAGKIEASPSGKKVMKYSFWRWVRKVHPEYPLPFHGHWLRTPIEQTSTDRKPPELSVSWRNTTSEFDQAAVAAIRALPEEQAKALVVGIRDMEEKIRGLEGELKNAIHQRDLALQMRDEYKARMKKVLGGRSGGGRKGGKNSH